MAKQKGLHKLAGKVDEQSYYYSKNGGYQSRKINPGIGERVKTAPEYQNTRKNNGEFGAAGACAGAMISEVTKRWRYLLDSIATGKMVKEIKALMELDTTSPWGQRVVELANLSQIQEKYNSFSKNQMDESIVDYLRNKCSYNATTHQLLIGGQSGENLIISDELLSNLESIGATGFRATLYAFSCTAPQYSAVTRKYLPAGSSLKYISQEDVPTATSVSPVISGDDLTIDVPVVNANGMLGGILVIFEPLKQVGSSNSVLQQHCSAFWTAIPTAA